MTTRTKGPARGGRPLKAGKGSFLANLRRAAPSETEPLTIGASAVAVVDALGFKGIWKRGTTYQGGDRNATRRRAGSRLGWLVSSFLRWPRSRGHVL